MELFKKKKKAVKGGCCGAYDAQKMEKAKAAQNIGAYVKILGSGCAKCNELETNTKAALKQLGMDSTIEHIIDFTQIASYGIMTTPALVIGGKVVSYGKVLKTEEVIKILETIG